MADLLGQISEGYLMLLSAASIVLFVIFVFVYLSSQPERSTGTKILDLLAMIFYTILFGVFLVVGLSIGNMIDSPAIGVCIGVFLFGTILHAYGYAKQRNKKK